MTLFSGIQPPQGRTEVPAASLRLAGQCRVQVFPEACGELGSPVGIVREISAWATSAQDGLDRCQPRPGRGRRGPTWSSCKT